MSNDRHSPCLSGIPHALGLRLALSLGLFSLLPPAHPAPLLRWTDEHGQVQYGTSLPPEHTRRPHTELSPHGIPLRSFDPTPSLDPNAAARQAIEREAQARAARDRILLQSFNSSHEIAATRDRRLAAIDAEIAVAQAYLQTLEQQLQQLVAHAAANERTGRPADAEQQAAIDETRRHLAENTEFIARKRREKDTAIADFARDIERYRSLTADRPDL